MKPADQDPHSFHPNKEFLFIIKLHHLSCHESYLDIVKFLLNEGATREADGEGDTLLHYAAFG